MAYKNWEVIKISYCDRADEEVALEAEIVYFVFPTLVMVLLLWYRSSWLNFARQK